MNTKNLLRNLKHTGLVLSLAFGFLMVSGITAKAQYRDDDNYRQQREQQKREERRERNRQRRDNDGYNNRNNNGYYGNNGNYRNDNGYYGNNNGYYGNNGGYNGYNNVYRMAQQYGYQDGVNKGMEDAREGHYNPQGTSLYRNATNGYNRSFGNKDAYRQAYRQAFLQGFDQGYNQSRNGYYRNGRRGY